MKLNQTQKVFLFVLLSFAAYYLLFLNFKPIKIKLDKFTHQGLFSYILTYLIIGIPIFIGTFLIDKSKNIFKSLGLSSNIFTAVWTSLLFTIPMFISGLIFFKFNQNIDIESLIAGTLIAGFMEELFFRGFYLVSYSKIQNLVLFLPYFLEHYFSLSNIYIKVRTSLS